MRLISLAILTISFYAANASVIEEIGIIGQKSEFVCEGKNGKWTFINETRTALESPAFLITQDENESKLVISNFQPINTGIYQCETDKTNQLFELKGFYPLSVTQSKKREILNEGGDVTFRCSSSGTPSPSAIYWWFGDTKLNNNSSSNSLTLKNITRDQAGEYTCVVEQKFKTYKSYQEKTFTLIVADQNAIYPEVKEVTVKANQSLQLTCINSTYSNLKFKWTFNDHDFVDENGNEITSNSIVLRNVKPDKAGKYSCQVLSGASSTVFELIVQHAPLFKPNIKTTVEGIYGKTSTLICEVDAEPIPQFEWFKNGLPIFDNVESFNRKSYLRVKVDSDDDFTNYTCKADNGIESRLDYKIVKSSENKGSNLKSLSVFGFILSVLVIVF